MSSWIAEQISEQFVLWNTRTRLPGGRTAVTDNRSSTPKGGPHYHDAVQACTFAVRDLHVRANDYLVRAEIIGKSDRTGYVAVARGKAIAKNKDVTAVGRGTSQAEADQKALALLNANC